MKILHTIYDGVDNPWCGGGGAIRAFEVNRRLARRHQVTMVTGNYPGATPRETCGGIRILRVGTVRTYALSRLSYSALASRCVSRMPFDLWVYDFSAFAPLHAAAPFRRKSVLLLHHTMAWRAVAKHPAVGLFSWAAEALSARVYPHIIAVSSGRARAIARRPGRRALVHTVYNGVDASCFVPDAEEQDYILYFGRLDTYAKGIDLLLEAFARIQPLDSHVRLIIAGRGAPDQQRKLEAMGNALGIKKGRVVFAGPVSDDRRAELFAGALFTCMPSRYEGWGITAIEAGAAGKAVIGTEIPGLTEAVRPGETGLLVPPEDADALAEAMQRLLNEPETRRRLGQAGRTWAGRFTWDRVAEAQVQVYEQILSARGARDVEP